MRDATPRGSTASRGDSIGFATKTRPARRSSIWRPRPTNNSSAAGAVLNVGAVTGATFGLTLNGGTQTFNQTALTGKEADAIIDAALAATGATSAQEMGKVMGQVMAKAKGRVDGGVVRSIA